MNAKPRRLSAEKSQQLTKLLTITKTATMNAVMAPSELARVIALVAVDIGKGREMEQRFPHLWADLTPPADYYSIGVNWFTGAVREILQNPAIGLVGVSHVWHPHTHEANRP